MNVIFQLLASVMQTFDDIMLSDVSRSCFHFMIGGILGSMLNVVIYRLPIRRNDALLADISDQFPSLISETDLLRNFKGASLFGRSVTPCCKNMIKPSHNIPIVSWIWLKGKCSYCESSIAPRYVIVELLIASLFAFAAYLISDPFTLKLTCLIIAVLVAIAFIDIDTKIIHPSLIGILFVLLAIGRDYNIFMPNEHLIDGVISMIVTWFMLNSINWLTIQFKNQMSLGGGDINLMAVLSVGLGVSLSLQILGAAIFLNLLYCGLKKIRGVTSLGQWIAAITIVIILTINSGHALMI